MEVTQIAQQLIDDLQKELTASQDNAKLIQGAMQGVQLLHQKLSEPVPEVQPSEQDNKSTADKKDKKRK